MQNRKLFARGLFFIFLLICLLTGLAGIVRVPANAAPVRQAATNIVISEFRTRGGGGASDEFVEIFNPTTNPISIDGWELRVLTGGGTEAVRATIPGGTTLAAGQHYLFTNSSSYSGSVTADQSYTTGVVDAGGVALFDNLGSRIDSVGTSSGSIYTEGTNLASLTQDQDQSYDRNSDISGACIDSDNNVSDFFLRVPSDPQNSSSPLTICGNPTDTPEPPTSTPTAAPPLSLIINEVAWAGTVASNTDEWFELYNPGGLSIDLSGWRLIADDGSPDIALSGTILAGDYFVVARYSVVFNDLTPDLTYSSGSFNNSGEILYLLDPNGNQVDTANLDGGDWPAGLGSPTYATMERLGVIGDDFFAWATYAGTIPVAHDRTGNDIKGTPGQANWITTVTVTPSPTNTATPSPTLTRTPTVTRTPSKTRTPTKPRTPTKAPTIGPAPLVAINEFVPRPGHDWNNDGVINVGDEYIELLNHGVIDVNLSGYSLDDEANIGSKPYRLPSITLKPGERIVFYGSETGLLLSDGGDGVRLLKPNGQLVDAYNYFVVNYPDQAYCRLPDNGGLDDWNKNCYPTPGLANSLSGDFVTPPPQVGDIQPLCPIADTLPEDFVLAECQPFGDKIWNRYYWDKFGWFGERDLPDINSKWEVYVD